jgi:D-alanine transaminase
VPVLDRGFIFGDGIYEVVPFYHGRPFRLEQHLARLARSLAAIRIAAPLTPAQWREVFERLVEPDRREDRMVYLQVTRGAAKRDFAFPPATAPTVFAMVSPLPRPSAVQRERGLRLVSWDDIRWQRCDIKSVSLLGAVLARQHAVDQGADEAAQFRDDYLTEASSANLWVVRGGRVLAPPLDHLILEGIRYAFVAELCAAHGIPFEARRIRRDEVAGADELLLTSATRELLPVTELDGKPIGSGRPGPVYARLRTLYDEAIAAL